jgi:Tol biopolymer transport system component
MSRHRFGLSTAVIAAALIASPALATPPGSNGLIAWQREAGNAPPRLWVANPDGSDARQVFRGSARQAEFEPTFSPTDPNVMFFSRGAMPFRPFSERIYRGDLSTGAVARVGSASRAVLAPTVSPDGTRLAYFAIERAPLGEGRPPPPQRIQVADVDGSRARSITPRSVLAIDPDWSPDGTRIAYLETRFAGGRFADRIVVINADGTGRRALTPYRPFEAINPKWMPDGRTIVFERHRERGRRSAIMAMPASGGRARTIYDSPGWDTNPIPSPDGTRILFTSDRHRPRRERLNPSFEVYTMAVDGSDVVRLTRNRSPDFFPDWQRLP